MPLPSVQLHSPHGSDRLVRLAASLRPALCDAVVIVGTQEFPAHSLVLAGMSPQLGRRGRWTLIEGISPPIFAHLLHFAYGETLELRPGELGPLWEAASVLGIETLEAECRRVLGEVEGYGGLKQYQEKPGEPIREARGKDRLKKLKLGKIPDDWQRSRGFARKVGEKQQEMEVVQAKELGESTAESSGGKQGKQGEVLVALSETSLQGLNKRLETSKECLKQPHSFIPQPASLQGNTITRPWCQEYQPILGGLLLLPRYGSPSPPSIPIPETSRALWPQEQRSLLPLSPPAALWGHSLLDNLRCYKSFIPCPGPVWSEAVQPSSPEKEISEEGKRGGLGGPPGASRSLPTGSRPYPCPRCGKKFSLKHQMETHYRVHTGEKPFSCRLCPQRSRDFSAMSKHLRTHGTAPYRCPLCRAGCPSVASMQAHMRSHPPGQLPPGWTIRSTFLYSSSRPSSSSSQGPPGGPAAPAVSSSSPPADPAGA